MNFLLKIIKISEEFNCHLLLPRRKLDIQQQFRCKQNSWIKSKGLWSYSRIHEEFLDFCSEKEMALPVEQKFCVQFDDMCPISLILL